MKVRFFPGLLVEEVFRLRAEMVARMEAEDRRAREGDREDSAVVAKVMLCVLVLWAAATAALSQWVMR